MSKLRGLNPLVLFSVSPFLDGYLTVAAGFVIFKLLTADSASAWDVSLFAGSFIFGTVLGAFFVGRCADRVGRRTMARWTLLPAMVASALGFFTEMPMVLVTAQLLLGMAIGADQPISQALVTELSPETVRKKRLTVLMLNWYVGALVAVAVDFAVRPDIQGAVKAGWSVYYLLPLCLTGVAWLQRWALLEGEGRQEMRSAMIAERRNLLSPEYRQPFLFCCGFWACQAIPVSVVMYYVPAFLAELLGRQTGMWQVPLLYLFFLLGTLPMLSPRISGRPMKVLQWTFVVMGAGLLGVSFFANEALLSVSLLMYALAYGMQSSLDNIFPNLLFPESIRATAVSTIFAFIRVLSAMTAMAVPFLMTHCGAQAVFITVAMVLFSGFLWTRHR